MKQITRSYTRLKVNFFKSALYGINVKSEEISEWAESLNCVEGSIPFKYLGIPVGANLRNLSTWTPVVDCLRRKLSNWKCESLSFCGRIVLLNAALSRGDRKIAWVSWEKVCNSIKDGGLGVKDLDRFNMALLGKWRWRLVVEKEALWNRVVEAKYGIHRRRDWEGREVKMNSSYWWKALWKLDKERGSNEGWVYKGVVKTVGEGNDTFFWHEKWCGDAPFREKFNRLFRLTKDKDVVVKNMGEWRNGEMENGSGNGVGVGINHLFFTCDATWAIWHATYAWWGVQAVLTCEGWKHLQQHMGIVQNKKMKEIWKYHVQVVNELQDGKSLNAHCKSTDDDLGQKILSPKGGHFEFGFKVNAFATTLFTCDLWFDQFHTGFKAFEAN
ncbi:hypothetical protein SLEP1_g712 [Rubroshorea leprosula]|uniref:Uncharacterized protein n=1 Tax=Rubroshorea leprosula TaxID=152421 RepID=A0AAV5HJS0_9ROSI|nr:hypothetical protein SLEP1_g712 [Rubroshorea leprosula]